MQKMIVELIQDVPNTDWYVKDVGGVPQYLTGTGYVHFSETNVQPIRDIVKEAIKLKEAGFSGDEVLEIINKIKQS